MINFNGKNCLELQEKIKEAGYWVEEVDGVWKASSINDVQNIIDNFDVTSFANVVCLKIEAVATLKRNNIIAPYSPGEMAAWPIKRAEALAYQASNDINSAPNLNAEATARGMSLPTLVTKVLNDAARFSWIEAHIAGTSGRHRDAIRLCQTHEEIMNYNYNTGWPV